MRIVLAIIGVHLLSLVAILYFINARNEEAGPSIGKMTQQEIEAQFGDAIEWSRGQVSSALTSGPIMPSELLALSYLNKDGVEHLVLDPGQVLEVKGKWVAKGVGQALLKKDDGYEFCLVYLMEEGGRVYYLYLKVPR